jgi:hypothetical protein
MGPKSRSTGAMLRASCGVKRSRVPRTSGQWFQIAENGTAKKYRFKRKKILPPARPPLTPSSDMTEIRHATVNGANRTFVRGGVRSLYLLPTSAGQSLRRPPAVSRTNRRDGPVSALASESISCVVIRSSLVSGPWVQFRPQQPTNTNAASKKETGAFGQTSKMSCSTQGVDSKGRRKARGSDSLAVGKPHVATNRGENHDLSQPIA